MQKKLVLNTTSRPYNPTFYRRGKMITIQIAPGPNLIRVADIEEIKKIPVFKILFDKGTMIEGARGEDGEVPVESKEITGRMLKARIPEPGTDPAPGIGTHLEQRIAEAQQEAQQIEKKGGKGRKKTDSANVNGVQPTPTIGDLEDL